MPDLLTIYGAITLVAICISLIVRMASGASAGELLVSRFYEIPTLRTVIISVGLGLWAATVYSAFITIEQTWLYFDSAPPGGGKVALLAVAACGALFLVSHLFWKTVVHFGDFRPTPDILDADIRPGIDPREIAAIGKEQFPEKLLFGANGCLSARRWLVAGGCLALALAALSFSSWGQQYGVEDLRIRTEHLVFGCLPSLPPDATYFLATTLLLSGLLLLLFTAADTLQTALPSHVQQVEELHGGRVYRADFQITAFHVIKIGFRGLQGGKGWFFGQRPEFYFPSLPLSWGKVAAFTFVFPFAVLAGIELAPVVQTFVRSALPN